MFVGHLFYARSVLSALHAYMYMEMFNENWTALEVMWKEVKGRESYASIRTSFHPNRWAGRALPTFRGRRKIRRTKIIEKGSIMS